MTDKIARSVEMEDAEYFLALWRHQHAGALPPMLNAQTLRQAILVFFDSCSDGRDEEQFLRVFNSGMGTFRRALPDCRDMKPRQRATRARAANRPLAELWNSLRERCRLHYLPTMGTPAEHARAPKVVPRVVEPGLAPMDGAARLPEPADNRNWTLRLIADRRGQTAFRDALFDRFDKKCVVTDCDLADVLEAAHIKPYAGEPGDQYADNGLLLRADIHTLFDLHLVGVNPDTLTVEWHPRLEASPHYGALTRKRISVLTLGGQQPRAEALRQRYTQFRAGRSGS